MEPWSLHWDGTRLREGSIELPDGRTIVLVTQADAHPLLGACDVIRDAEGTTLARFAAVDWAQPRSIPALDVPGALPTGAGSAVLDLLARRARAAEIAALRYCGPYPTEALFDTLRGSFAVDPAMRERFTADVEHVAFAGTSVTPAVDFAPDPHRWSRPHPRVCAQHRHGLERAWIDGRAWDRGGHGPRRLRREGDAWRVVFELGGMAWCIVATLDDDGRPKDEPLATMPVASELVGLALPEAARDVLGETLVAGAITALRPAIAELVHTRPLVFDDTGFELATVEPTRIVLHTGIAEQLATLPPARSLALLAAALHDCVARAAQRQLAAALAVR